MTTSQTARCANYGEDWQSPSARRSKVSCVAAKPRHLPRPRLAASPAQRWRRRRSSGILIKRAPPWCPPLRRRPCAKRVTQGHRCSRNYRPAAQRRLGQTPPSRGLAHCPCTAVSRRQAQHSALCLGRGLSFPRRTTRRTGWPSCTQTSRPPTPQPAVAPVQRLWQTRNCRGITAATTKMAQASPRKC